MFADLTTPLNLWLNNELISLPNGPGVSIASCSALYNLNLTCGFSVGAVIGDGFSFVKNLSSLSKYSIHFLSLSIPM